MSAGDLSIQYGWLVSEAGEHTCAIESSGAHEPGCGFVPELDLTTLDGWPRADSHTAAIAEAAREYVATQRCFSDDEFKPADVRRAVEAHKALYAAVDAERAEREGKT